MSAGLILLMIIAAVAVYFIAIVWIGFFERHTAERNKKNFEERIYGADV